MITALKTIVVGTALLVAAACGDSTPDPNYRPSSDDQMHSLNYAWDQESAAEQQSLCDGYYADPIGTIHGYTTFDYDVVKQYFDSKCP